MISPFSGCPEPASPRRPFNEKLSISQAATFAEYAAHWHAFLPRFNDSNLAAAYWRRHVGVEEDGALLPPKVIAASVVVMLLVTRHWFCERRELSRIQRKGQK